jgi:phosphoribosylformylglycinamidine synthase
MSGTFKDIDVPPTLCSFCLAPVAAKHVITPEFKKAGNKLYRIKVERDDDFMPDFADIIHKYEKLEKLIHDKVVVSASAVGRGGYLVSAVKSAMGNGLGVKMFSESKKRLTQKCYGEILVEAAEISDPDFKLMGEIREEPYVEVGGEKIPLKRLQEVCCIGAGGRIPHAGGRRRGRGQPPVRKKERYAVQI